MKKLVTYLFLIIAFLGFNACEKVVDLDLDESEQLYVIEGIVHDSLGDNFVLISQSQYFNDQNPFQQITNATVKIIDNLNNVYNLYQTKPGYYTDSTLQGISNRLYTLVVNIDGKQVTAQSLMPPRVELDSLSIEEEVFEEGPNGEQKYRVNCHFTDPVGYENFYRFKGFEVANNQLEQVNGFLAISDEYFDGLPTYFPFFDASFFEEDSVIIQFLSIDEANYRYFTAIELSQQGEVPGNPETNLQGENVVGYFGAYAKSQRSILITP